MKPISLHDFYRLYSIHFMKNGEMHRILLGTFAIYDGGIHIFSDETGWIQNNLGHGDITPAMQKRLDHIKRSQYLDMVSEYEIKNGYRPDLLPNFEDSDMATPAPEPEVNTDDKKKARPAPVWDFFTVGQDEPERLEVKNKKMYLNGELCTDSEHDYITKLLQTGGATLRYPRAEKDPMKLGKMEQFFERLSKADPQPGDEEYGFENLFGGGSSAIEAAKFAKFDEKHWPVAQQLNHSGAMSDDDFNAIRKAVYEDTLTEGIGNKRAYYAFMGNLSKTRQRGTHIILDGNSFKSINDISYPHGDEALRMYGRAFRRAIDNGIGKENVKAHRFGGDEFHFWVPEQGGETPEAHQAKVAKLLRDMRGELESSTPKEGFSELNTSHKLSFSAGVGKSPQAADMAIKIAKSAKKTAGKRPGEEGFHVHSLAGGSSPLALTEIGVGDSLEKAIPSRGWQDFHKQVMSKFGWSDPSAKATGSGHFGSTHPSGMTWKGYSNSDKVGNMSGDRQKYFAGQVGLRAHETSTGEVWGYVPGTQFEAGYKAMGAPSIVEAKEQAMKGEARQGQVRALKNSLRTSSQEPNPYIHNEGEIDPSSYVDISKIGHGITDEELASPNFAHRAKQAKPGPLPVMDIGDGTMVTTDDELLHRLRSEGYTHVPVIKG